MPFLSRIKIMAKLDIAEKRRPQDGRIRIEKDNKNVDLRVSTLPTEFGEKIVLRILDKSEQQLELRQLGFEDSNLHEFRKAIANPYGMILVTGPTGSGPGAPNLFAMQNRIRPGGSGAASQSLRSRAPQRGEKRIAE